MNHPERLKQLLTEAAAILFDAQAHADAWDREQWGRYLDPLRWRLEDFTVTVTHHAGGNDLAAMFSSPAVLAPEWQPTESEA